MKEARYYGKIPSVMEILRKGLRRWSLKPHILDHSEVVRMGGTCVVGSVSRREFICTGKPLDSKQQFKVYGILYIVHHKPFIVIILMHAWSSHSLIPALI